MAGPELSRRIGRAVCGKPITLNERDAVVDAAVNVDDWDELPRSVQLLVEEIESRSDTSRSTLPDEDNVARAEEDAGEKRSRTLALLGVTRAAGHDVTPGNDQLHHYWTRGEGLAKWIESDHQFYTLRDLLAKATDGKIPLETLSRWTASWVHEVTGQWPGSDAHRVAEGHKPRGHHVGPG